MVVKRLILFRFHENFEVCLNRIVTLRRLNPGVGVHGLYGGTVGIGNVLANQLDTVHSPVGIGLNKDRAYWMWRNGDLAVRLWFREVGNQFSFDMLHLVEWDFLMLESVEKLFSHVGPGSVGLTGLMPLGMVPKGWEWLRCEELDAFSGYANDILKQGSLLYACLGPGLCLPRAFLEKYAAIEPTWLCNDELRLPLYAQALGFGLCDTNLIPSWHTDYFNCNRNEIPDDIIVREMAKPDGRRVFHPFCKVWDRQIL
jgi:hypothetical protein